MGKHLKRRIPKLSFTKMQGIGWHCVFRDVATGKPRRKRFGSISKADAVAAYQAWLSEHLGGNVVSASEAVTPKTFPVTTAVTPGSLLAVASSYLRHEESRTRSAQGQRQQGTISPTVLAERKHDVQKFLSFINRRHGHGAVGRLSVIDLPMADVEAFNKELIAAGHSNALVQKRFMVVKSIIDRAGRPEHGEQRLSWNWDSRDVFHGKPTEGRMLPTLPQLKAVLEKCDERLEAIVWIAIGLGFGQGDLSAVRVDQIDEKGYDLRRGKTGLDRYGETPPGVWHAIQAYRNVEHRGERELLFTTRGGMPLVHGNTDTVHLWWRRLREGMGGLGKKLGGFYVLRHLGATEYGSRPTCSIGHMRRWLGHSASSAIADTYMRPVAPEHRAVVEFVRSSLIG